MALRVDITGITGQTPYNIFICQNDGSSCIFIDTITINEYGFDIPYPYDLSNSYMLKIIDGNNAIISGVTYVS
jgi:hypothetical protein